MLQQLFDPLKTLFNHKDRMFIFVMKFLNFSICSKVLYFTVLQKAAN